MIRNILLTSFKRRRGKERTWNTLSVSDISMFPHVDYLVLEHIYIIIFIILGQRRMKVKSIEREDDPDAAIAKVIVQVKGFKVERFQIAVEIKVQQTVFSINILQEVAAW